MSSSEGKKNNTVLSEPRDLNIQKALEVQQEIEALDSFISKLYNDLKNKQKDFEKTNTELEEEYQKVSKLNNQNLTEIRTKHIYTIYAT